MSTNNINNNYLEQARFNMIEQQIRPAEVLDPRVLDVIANIPREQFVPEEYVSLAYSDSNIPLGQGQIMLKPILEARILQALDIKPNEKVLEIGTGSAFLTALLSNLGHSVVSVEVSEKLANMGKKNLQGQNISNVSVEVGDASKGWKNEQSFDIVVLTGSLPVYSDCFAKQLNIGGRLFTVVGTEPAMSAMLITRISENEWREDSLFETVVPALNNVEQPQQFVF